MCSKSPAHASELIKRMIWLTIFYELNKNYALIIHVRVRLITRLYSKYGLHGCNVCGLRASQYSHMYIIIKTQETQRKNAYFCTP